MSMPFRPSPDTGHAVEFWKRQIFGSVQKEARNKSQSEGSFSRAPDAAPAVNSPFSNPMPAQDDIFVSRDVSIALTYGLELVRYGAILIASEGQPRLANRTALSILEKNDGISLSRTGLVADRAADTRLLINLLHEAITAPQSGEPKESPFTLPRKKAPSSLIVRVVPGPVLDCWTADDRAALVMLYDQDMQFAVNADILSRLYGLTRGEAALAASLVRGKSIEEAAEELFISPHTARTHLKRIFMKTDTHRQTELVVRIFPAVL
jgi:DNA-binding CsgD family transcriptional regulator